MNFDRAPASLSILCLIVGFSAFALWVAPKMLTRESVFVLGRKICGMASPRCGVSLRMYTWPCAGTRCDERF